LNTLTSQQPARAEVLQLSYQHGFGNEFQSEALPGALPVGQNSPQRAPLGLVSELVSGTTFSAARASNRRTYLFRIRPSTSPARFEKMSSSTFLTPPYEVVCDPNDYAWSQFECSSTPADFVESLRTICGNGSPRMQVGMSMHVYRATRSMRAKVFSDADGEMLIIPQKGMLRLVTELGVLAIAPSEVALIPKGIKFRVELDSGRASGFVCENYGAPFRLPDMGLLGSNGLANTIDFMTPVAAYEDVDTPVQLVHKFGGSLWTTELDHSPLDVVAWRGNLAPCKYDMRHFVAVGSVTIDHLDPSIYCALTSPSDPVAGPNAEFMVLPPRWNVAERTLPAPGFHRNCVTEFAGFLGAPDGPGAIGSILHNSWVPHGPTTALFEGARTASLAPQKIAGHPTFMIESRFPMELTQFAVSAPGRHLDHASRWGGFTKRFPAG
jgi:homogentisate 1,2-dioxygenase